MKRRTLFLTSPLILSLVFFLYLNRSGEPLPEGSGEAGEPGVPGALTADREASLRAVAEADYIEEELPADLAVLADSEMELVKARRVEPRNLSGVELASIPAGVSRVDEVLFESQIADGKGVLRSRVLKTDFHYPLLQTVELSQVNPDSGEEEVVAYQSMVADHLLVQLDLGSAPDGWERLLADRGFGIRRKVTDEGLYTLNFKVEEAGQVAKLARSLQEDLAWVEYAEPDLVIAARSHDPIPNDTYFDFQWGLRNTGAFFGGTPGADINAVDAWAMQERGGEPAPGAGYWYDGAAVEENKRHVIVAILDTGINYRHLDLAPNMWINPQEREDFMDTDGNGFVDDIHGASFVWDDGDPMDFNGHGTHVAGTIGAVGDNQRGVAGVAWDVKLMAVQFLNEFGGGVLSDSVGAIDYAWHNGAHVINNSWGFDAYGRWISGAGPSASLSGAIRRSRNAGAIFVTAAGNDSTDVDVFPDYPAGHQATVDNVVNVGAMEPTGNRSVWFSIRFISFFPFDPDIFLEIGSNYGAEQVHVFAPGSDILSTYVGDNNNGYAFLDGTSMACPHVSGMYAILKAEFPNEPYDVLIQRLLQRADRDSRLAGFGQQGRRGNLAAALDPAPLIFLPLKEEDLLPGGTIVLRAGVSASGVSSANSTYRWYRNDEVVASGSVPAADQRGVILFEREVSQTGLYRFEVTSPFGTSSSLAQINQREDAPEAVALGGALGAPYLSWSTAGSEPWVLTNPENPIEGARNDTIGDGGFSQIKTTVTGPGTLDFMWKVSSERQYDEGIFLINGGIQERISDESGWLPRQVAIPAGTHELAWVYAKDSSGAGGEDALWLKDVAYVSEHPVVVGQNQSGTIQVVRGGSIMFAFEATGAETLGYWWKKDEQLISGATDAALTLHDIQTSDAGTYVGVVGNSHGVARIVPITIEVVDVPLAPEFVQHPQSFFGFAGASMSISADWKATYPESAQWHKDGQPLPGQTGSVLSLTGVAEDDSGQYTLVVSNAAGQTESHPGIVTIYPAQVSFSEYAESLPTDGDVEKAIVRFALGLDAVEDEASGLPKFVMERDIQVGIASAGGSAGGTGDFAFPALEFNRPINATGVRYVLEASSDLLNWKEVSAMMEPVGKPEGILQRVRLREVEPVGKTEKRRFLRLRLEVAE